jgi:NADH:ubiquinone oxidoreductase subunit 4 (subunit M)
MQGFMDAINFNSYAYMAFILGIVGVIYIVLFTLVKLNIKKQ